MTEEEWLTCIQTRPMLRNLLGLLPDELRVQDVESFPFCRGSDRKLRLFACACYRRVSHLLPNDRARAAVEVAERVADGLLPVEELEWAKARIREPIDALEPGWRASRGAERKALLPTHAALSLGLVVLWREAQKAAYYASSNAYLAVGALDESDRRGASERGEEQAQTDLLRDIFGNPLRPVPFAPSWRTSTAASLASHIDATGEFEIMPILADALMDAGCFNNEVLGHCRGSGPHVRGCWVVDLLLDKK
jgi:hypothetical protein